MNYFECKKCGNSFVYNGSHIPFKCGTFIGMKEVKKWVGGNSHDIGVWIDEVPQGCGGEIIKMTKERADSKVENLRS